MASPHVAGAAAKYLQTAPTAAPATVTTYLVNQSTKNLLTGVIAPAPNRLLYTIQ